MFLNRRDTKVVKIGNVKIGGRNPIVIQSMTNTDTRNVKATVEQIKRLASLGCEVVRVSIPDEESAEKVKDILKQSPIPVIGDIHFDYKLAIKAIASGINAIRINPGNIGDKKNVEAVAKAAGEKGIPIRVGANSGSISSKYKRNQTKATRTEFIADCLVESAIEQCSILENFSFYDIKVSLKASDVLTTITAYEKFSQLSNYPLHLGVTEAGTLLNSAVKSSIGIGHLLLKGIGDTIRVSVTGEPEEEIPVAVSILESLGIRKGCPEIISCPTCARTSINLVDLVHHVEAKIKEMKAEGIKFKPFKIAIMGCAVNGPGEAKDADIGIAGANGYYVIFKAGKTFKKCQNNDILNSFLSELNNFIQK